VGQGVGPEFKPQYRKKKKKRVSTYIVSVENYSPERVRDLLKPVKIGLTLLALALIKLHTELGANGSHL
jgi:hypothetical protein